MNATCRFCVVGALLLAALSATACNHRNPHYSSSTEYTAEWGTVEVPAGTFVTSSASTTMNEPDYKRHCLRVDYKDFEDDLSAHKGEDVYFIGEVSGVGSADGVPLPSLSAVTPGLLGSVSVYLGHVDSSESGMNAEVLWPEPLPDVRFGTGQVVEVWGECQGAVNYELDPSSDPLPNLPVIRARYMTVHTP